MAATLLTQRAIAACGTAALQFGLSEFQGYPNCTIQGDSTWCGLRQAKKRKLGPLAVRWHARQHWPRGVGRYGQRFVRALDGTFAEEATRCGVNIVSGDYQQVRFQPVVGFLVGCWLRVTQGCCAASPMT